jgi:hypothetical protein
MDLIHKTRSISLDDGFTGEKSPKQNGTPRTVDAGKPCDASSGVQYKILGFAQDQSGFAIGHRGTFLRHHRAIGLRIDGGAACKNNPRGAEHR